MKIGVSSAGRNNAGSLSIVKPTGTIDGDVMVAFVMSVGSAPTTVPSGWSQVQQNSNSTSFYLTTYVKVASSEGSSYTWALTGSNSMAIVMESHRGIDVVTPIGTQKSVAAASSSTTALNGAAVTTGAANETVIWAGASFGSVHSIAVTPPSAMTTDMQKVVGGFTDFILTVAEAVLASAGATGATYNNGTQSVACPNLVHMVALTNVSAPHAITTKARSKLGFGDSSATGFGSIYHNGSQGSLNGSEFTAEIFVYYVVGAGNQTVIDWGGSGASTTPKIYVDATGHVVWRSAGATQITSSITLAANAWESRRCGA